MLAKEVIFILVFLEGRNFADNFSFYLRNTIVKLGSVVVYLFEDFRPLHEEQYT